MNKPALPFLLAAILLVAALAVWLALGQTERSGRGAPAPEPVAAPAASEPAPALVEPPLVEEPPPAAENAPESSLAATESAEETRAATESGGGRRIHGFVRASAAAPPDPSLRVIALASSVAPRNVYGTGGVVADLAAGKGGSSLGTAAVGADGAFSLALARADDVWLAVDGRFLYSSQLARVPAGTETVELAAELGGCLAGSVRLQKGDPAVLRAECQEIHPELGIDGQDFSMASLGTAPVFGRAAKLDEEGRFELRALPVSLTHELEVKAKNFADVKVSGLEFEPGVVRAVEVALLDGGTLRGTVRDESGAAVPEAEVVAAESAIWGFPGEELAETKSDASGAFALEHVAPGKCLLIAKKEGALESEALALEVRDQEIRDGLALVVGRGASIAGTVHKPNSMGAAGADVEVSFDPEALVGMGAFNAARGASGKAKARDDGSFEVTGLGKGPFVVKATLEQESSGGTKEKLLAKAGHVKPGTLDLALTLAAPSAVAGRVRTVDGLPVTEFVVRARLESATFFMPGESREQRGTDAEGDFELRDLEAGTWKLAASADGFGPMTPVDVTLPRADESPIELVLAPAAGVAGRVLDPTGAPIGGAKVTLHLDNAERLRNQRGDVTQPETRSLDDGTFLLEPLGAGTTSIQALHAEYAASEPFAVETRAGERVDDVVLELRRGGVVTGEVYGGDGKPATRKRIVAQQSGSWDSNMRTTDGEGRFRFEALAPGPWTITALLEESTMNTDEGESQATAAMLDNLRFTMVELEEGEEEHVVLGAPPKDPVLVRGRVLHGDAPVANGMISFFGEGSKGLEALKLASLDADGRYETQLGAPGRYVATVQINASGAAFQQQSIEFRETIPEVDEHRLDFTLPLGGIRGRVVDGERSPLGGTRVTLATDGGIELGSMLGGQYAEATTDDQGGYAFEYLRPGTYAVAAGGALFGGAFGGGGKSTAGRALRAGLRVDEGKQLDGIDFELGASGEIGGRVVDRTGQPVKDASVFVRNEEGRLLDRFSLTSSAADGTFTYAGVAPGEYVVSARGKDLASGESATVRVGEGGSAQVELVLNPGTRLVIEVVDAEDAPLEARLTVTDDRGREVQGMFGLSELAGGFADGFDSSKHKIGPLAPGSYTVIAVAGDKKASKPVTLDGQPERKLKLRLR